MLDFAIVAIYLLLVLSLGIKSGLRVNTFSDYAVSKKRFPTTVVVTTLFATLIGGGSVMGFCEKVYEHGVIFFVMALGFFLGDLLLAYLIIPQLKRFNNCLSVGDMMADSYGDLGKFLTGVSGVVFGVVGLSIQGSCFGYLLTYFLDLPHWLGVALGLGTVIIYSSFGGIKSVTITDVLQFFMLVVAVQIMYSYASDLIGGGFGYFSIAPIEKLTLIPSSHQEFKLYSLFVFYVFPSLTPILLQRLLICENWRQAKKSYLIFSALRLPFFIMVTTLGLTALILAPGLAPNQAFPFLINQIMPSGIRGIAIIGLFAVIMSTADSFLHLSSLMFSHDVLKPIFQDKLDSKRELFVARCSNVLFGIFAMFVAISIRDFLDLSIIGYLSWAPIITVPLLACLFNIRSSKKALIFSASSGLVSSLAWKFFVEPKWPVECLIPSVLTSFLVFFVVTVWEKILDRKHREFFKTAH